PGPGTGGPAGRAARLARGRRTRAPTTPPVAVAARAHHRPPSTDPLERPRRSAPERWEPRRRRPSRSRSRTVRRQASRGGGREVDGHLVPEHRQGVSGAAGRTHRPVRDDELVDSRLLVLADLIGDLGGGPDEAGASGI